MGFWSLSKRDLGSISQLIVSFLVWFEFEQVD